MHLSNVIKQLGISDTEEDCVLITDYNQARSLFKNSGCELKQLRTLTDSTCLHGYTGHSHVVGLLKNT